nr:molybdate ABC transporter substrate-binding protein [uncultured Aminipila sp.]
MKKIVMYSAILIIAAMIFTSCGNNKGKHESITLNVSAAASLTDALNEISTEYAKTSTDKLLFNFAGSGALMTQIEEGAPCDLFISASEEHMDELDTQGLIEEKTRVNLLGNTLTLIASEESKDSVSMDSLASDEVKSIAIGTPESVPAGKYAQQSFDALGITEQVRSKLILGKDVRSVLDYVETGNVDCGFVYKTDALLLKSGAIIQDIPQDYHKPIVYPMAVLSETRNKEAITEFYEFLQTEYAKDVFEKYGFTIL